MNVGEIRPLSSDEVLEIVTQEIQDSVSLLESSELAFDRGKAVDHYFGRPFGNEVEGRSKVVLTDVADTIEWIMPSLMRMFFLGDTIAEYEPESDKDVAMAEQATRGINELFVREHQGFMLFLDAFKTALLEKRSFLACEYVERMNRQTSTFRGLTEVEFGLLVGDENIELISAEEVEQTVQGEDGQPVPVKLYNVRVTDSRARGKIECFGVAPEHMLIERRAVTLDEKTRFCGYRSQMSISDLIGMGYDEKDVRSIPSDDAPDMTEGALKRFGNTETAPSQGEDRTDLAARRVWVTKCYIRIDEDGDGFTELRRIVIGGDSAGAVLLEDEEVNEHPFASLCPIPFPHKFFGLSIADIVMDLQLIRSTLLRNLLDSVYITNNPRTVVVEGQVQVEDLLTSRPGGLIRAMSLDSVGPLETGRLDRWAFDMLEYLENTREQRTGVTRYNQGLDASSLNKTATGITSLLNAANSRIELIARIFAETGIKDFFKKLLHLYTETDQKARTIRMQGQWVTMDPSRWSHDMDLTIRVGLGIGQAAERMQNLQTLLGAQAQAVQFGMGGLVVKPRNFYNVVAEMTQTMGFKAVGQFWTDPGNAMPPPPPPDPKQIQAQSDQQKNQQDYELRHLQLAQDAQRAQADATLKQRQLDQEREIQMAKIESDQQVAIYQADLDATLRREEMALKATEAKKPKGGGAGKRAKPSSGAFA